MKKNLFRTLICLSIIASMFLTLGVSAASLENPTSSAGDPWGVALQQYSDRSLAYVTNWGGHTIKAARSNREGYGDCLRVQENGHDNWVYVGKIGSSADLLTVGTEYTLSVDCLPGPFPYNRPSVGLKFDVGGAIVTFAEMDHLSGTEWKTFTKDFTPTKTYSPRLQLTTQGADLYLDNLVITEKATGNVVFYHNFDMLKTKRIHDWGYDPVMYAETNAVPFYGIPGDDIIGVIDRGDSNGYAAYIINEKSYDVSWRFSDVEAIVRALPVGTTCTVTFDYIYCDAGTNNNYLADRMTWDESWGNTNNKWTTYTNTFESKTSTQCGFKIKPGCRMCVDNFRIYDSENNLIAEKDFDTVPLLSGANQFIVEPITLSQSSNTMNVSAKVTNSFADTKSVSLITAIYNNNVLEDIDCINLDIVGDPRGINHTTTINSEIGVSGKAGKTFKAFLWDMDKLESLVASKTKTID